VRVLITGVTGFAGRHLAALCVGAGDEVHGVVRPGREGAAPGGVSAHPADVTDAGEVAAVLDRARPEAVIHLAGMASVGQSFAEPLETWRVNLCGTLAVLEALRRSAAASRCVVVTSGEVYGRVAPEDLPLGPGHPLHPLSPYGASKAAADLAAGQYRAAGELDVVRVRAFNQIGPGQDARFVLPSVCRQIVAAERRGDPSVDIRVGNVETRRDFTDVRDMVRAYRLLAERGGGEEPYLACSGHSIPVRDLVEGVARLARIPATVRSDAGLRREGEQPDLYGSPARLRDETGWAPAIPLTDTLRDTLDWWRAREEEG